MKLSEKTVLLTISTLFDVTNGANGEAKQGAREQLLSLSTFLNSDAFPAIFQIIESIFPTELDYD